MPRLLAGFYQRYQLQPTRQYIETGTYMGDGVFEMVYAPRAKHEHVHSIELSERWYHYNVGQFKKFPNVSIHLGDSATVLPALLDEIQEPVTVFLDGHFSGANTAHGSEETPLLRELDILKRRPFNDIIIIDDTRMLGKKGTSGGDSMYPELMESTGPTLL